MLHIPYVTDADPWYLFGKAVGNGLSALAENREMRGAAKQFELDEAKRREKEYGTTAGKLRQLSELYSDPEKNKDQIGFLRAGLVGQLGGEWLPTDVDGVNTFSQKYLDKANKMSQFADINRGKRYHDGWTSLLDYDV